MPEADSTLTDERMNVALGGEVRKVREAAGLTRPDLVALLPFKIEVNTLLNWELGHRGISYARLVGLARTLNTTAAQLLNRAESQVAPSQTRPTHSELLQAASEYTKAILLSTCTLNTFVQMNDREGLAVAVDELIKDVQRGGNALKRDCR